MFGRMMNNYYYGKSGKGDFRREDLPHNRKELFFDTLKTRLSALCRINLLYVLVFLPAMIVIMLSFTNFLTNTDMLQTVQANDYESFCTLMTEREREINISEEDYNKLHNQLRICNYDYNAYVELLKSEDPEAELTEEEFAKQWKNANEVLTSPVYEALWNTAKWLILFLAITGPFTAGLSYVTRNWARDEHAFIWTDFKDAMKANWKQSLVLSCITALLPAAVYLGWFFYGDKANDNMIWMIPQVLVVLVALIWSISITYMHPLVVTYDLKTRDVIRNGLLLGVARLPMSIGIRLLHCVPLLIGMAVAYFLSPLIGMMGLFAYYVLIGFALSRFITASYTNAVFDRYINSRIEGAEVNRGLHKDEDEDEEDEDEEEPERDANE